MYEGDENIKQGGDFSSTGGELTEKVMKMKVNTVKGKRSGPEKVKIPCFRCGSTNDLANNVVCQARGKLCHNCKKRTIC